jgi:hypothetical protein
MIYAGHLGTILQTMAEMNIGSKQDWGLAFKGTGQSFELETALQMKVPVIGLLDGPGGLLGLHHVSCRGHLRPFLPGETHHSVWT